MGINPSENSLTVKKAVFIDRDGALIKHVDLLTKIEEVEFFEDSKSAVRSWNKMGFLVVMITNQAVVARGLIDEKGIEEIHAFIVKELGNNGAKMDAVYYCPHHPEATLENYRINCDCRKPNPGMIIRALREHGVDPHQSYMIGDSMSDIKAGKQAGTKTILLKTGPGHATDKDYKDLKPDFIALSLTDAVELIKNNAK